MVEFNQYDIFEQIHFKNDPKNLGQEFSDFEMFLNYSLQPNEVGLVEIYQTDAP